MSKSHCSSQLVLQRMLHGNQPTVILHATYLMTYHQHFLTFVAAPSGNSSMPLISLSLYYFACVFQYGDTPLHTSARYGHAGIARILISAKCSIGEQNKNGDTALHITAAFIRRKIANLLVEAGINTLIRNKVSIRN